MLPSHLLPFLLTTLNYVWMCQEEGAGRFYTPAIAWTCLVDTPPHHYHSYFPATIFWDRTYISLLFFICKHHSSQSVIFSEYSRLPCPIPIESLGLHACYFVWLLSGLWKIKFEVSNLVSKFLYPLNYLPYSVFSILVASRKKYFFSSK